jgi:hypothetical protein
MDKNRFEESIRSIYSAVAELEEMFPGRHFTPDGHMVGSIGEALASHYYGIRLHRSGNPVFDGTVDGKQVQIKATQRDSVDLKGGEGQLLVLKIRSSGEFDEVYNGDASRVWKALSHRKRTKAGEVAVTINQLRKLNREVRPEERIGLVNQPAD